MKKKIFDATVTDNGSIEGHASTWDRIPDSYGDIVKKGAFAKSLEKWKESDHKLPLLWSHNVGELDSFIGTVEADEDEKGLHFVGKFDDTQTAQRVRSLYKDGRLSKFSFAYDVLDEATVTLENGQKANELRELELYEISCVAVPANPLAEVLDIKAADLDEDTLDGLIEKIEDVANSLREMRGDGDTGEDEPEVNSEEEEPKESNPKKEKLLNIIKNMEETK